MIGTNYSEEEALEIISNIKQLSAILVEHILEEEKAKKIESD